MTNTETNVGNHPPHIAHFLCQIAETRRDFVEKEYGENGRIGSLIEDITPSTFDEDEMAAGKTRYIINVHQFFCIDCFDGDEEVLAELDRIERQAISEPAFQLMIADSYYSHAHRNLEYRVQKKQPMIKAVAEAYEAASAVQTVITAFGDKPDPHRLKAEHQPLIDAAADTFRKAQLETGRDEFYIAYDYKISITTKEGGPPPSEND